MRKRGPEHVLAKSRDDDRKDASLNARLGRLSSSLKSHETPRAAPDAPSGDTGFSGMGLGLRVVTELVAGILVGGGLGWLLDKWLSTKPILLIVFLLLGAAGGFWNVVRATILPSRGSK